MQPRAGRYRLLVLLLVAIAARWVTFGNPVVHVDEEFYYFTGTALWHGQLPFVDVWDRKPVGLFLLYALPARLGFPAGIWAYQAMALAATVMGGEMVARLADRLGFARGALAGASAYILWLDLLGGQGGQTPVFYNPLMLGAALLILRGGRPRGIAAMALVGVALQIKYSAVFEGVFFGLWLLVADRRASRSVVATAPYALALVAAAALPTALAAGYYAAIGQWNAFWFANFLSIFHRNADPPIDLIRNLGQVLLIVSPPVAIAIAALRGAAGGARRFVAWWLAVAIVSVLMFLPWFDHYALPILPPACAAAAGVLGGERWRRRRTPALLLVTAIAGQIVLVVLRHERGDGANLAVLADAVGGGPGCLYVYSGNVMLYVATGRCAPSRYVVPSHLGRTREFGATGVDQDAEIARILAKRPAVIVMRPVYHGERLAARAQVTATVARYYRLVAMPMMGREAIAVYRLVR